MLPINFFLCSTYLKKQRVKIIIIIKIIQIIPKGREILPDTSHLHFLRTED